jgi:protein-disulfide isomerase
MPRLVKGFFSAAVLLALASTAAHAQSTTDSQGQVQQSRPGGFSPEQVEGIEHIVRQYLLENPQVLVDALTAYQQRQRVAEEERQQQAVVAHRAALNEDPSTPVLGNPAGDVVIVEFFDYRCGYCRRVVRDLRDVVEKDGKVRLVMKEFPILGPASIQAARAALASVKQGKYEAYHYALMTQPGDMSDPHLMEVAKMVGLDVDQLKTDMESDEIEAMIRRNHALAEALSIGGTPAFVFGDTLVPGAIDAETMRRLIAEARAKAG